MNIPDKPTFEIAEYRARTARLRALLRDRGIDVLLVTSPSNLYWLTDYEASWYPPRLPVGVAVWADDERTVFFDWSRHEEFLPYDALYDEAEFIDYGTAHVTVAEQLARRMPGATVAIEWSSPTPVPGVMVALGDELRARGCTVVAGEWIVDGLRVYKSPAEQERVVAAGRMADQTFRGLQERLRPGMSELEVAALVDTLMSEQGGEVPAQHPLVASGPSAWRDVHSFPSRRILESGDIVSVDCSAVVDRYHVNLCRVFSLGGPHPRVSELLAATQESLDVLCAHAELGADPAIAMGLAERALRRTVAPEDVWWTGGYGLGISFPPSWVGHTYLANDGPHRITLEEGYVSNFESILRDRVAHYEAAAIDTVMMTAAGLAPLSAIPRELLIVE
ncbi:M24 family metallopeptidase [Microbacterium rhizomatis]|uniref:Aminopeptidase P family protein n=1 Tax=Microbacterium rhizomatis TaxID=1631477 RepID=A0A5J5J058_9MICO|nr:Xaa-Pro peptidase family protein [Microbacterium rhizomatis]KAA9108032.1 aminopeptidase P family protein [Microbacterium rhizomatis]